MVLTGTDLVIMVLLCVLVITALALYFLKDLIHAVVVFGLYSITMSVVWSLLNAPDIAITEAAAGIGTTVLMMVVISRTNRKEE
jgi:energy-converting hydrogenase B subunit D